MHKLTTLLLAHGLVSGENPTIPKQMGHCDPFGIVEQYDGVFGSLGAAEVID